MIPGMEQACRSEEWLRWAVLFPLYRQAQFLLFEMVYVLKERCQMDIIGWFGQTCHCCTAEHPGLHLLYSPPQTYRFGRDLQAPSRPTPCTNVECAATSAVNTNRLCLWFQVGFVLYGWCQVDITGHTGVLYGQKKDTTRAVAGQGSPFPQQCPLKMLYVRPVS